MAADGYILKIPQSVLNKLNSADDKIKKLAETSQATQSAVMDAFSKMASGIDPFINKLKEASSQAITLKGVSAAKEDLGLLANSVAKLSEMLNKLNTGKERQVASIIDVNSFKGAETSIDAVKEKIKELKRAISDNREKVIDDTQKKNATDLINELNRLSTVQKKLTEEERKAKAERRAKSAEDRKAVQAENAYRNALNRSENSIAQRMGKIEALRRAQERLTATGRNYTTELRKISTETARLQRDNEAAAQSTDKLRANQSRLMNTSEQLKRQLALLFSVSAIEGYISKLIKVRGEFELQQRSLQSILQSKDKANEIWDKTVALAIKSPFTVKELVSYTKQLAAYRVETDKLYETNKMLADVSAGLGVDMQRLILAYGQVKAANYLRGTELRQFSEAGINILGELATYFSEIENRAISVGEVFEMVSKRMVSFADVEEIFKRVTSAGGLFYNMQEVQAETLQGQMSNLQDSIDIMLNDIGKANGGLLKGFVSLTRQIVENWERIADVVVPAVSAFLLYKSALISITAYQSLSNALHIVSNTLKRKEVVLRAANIAAIRRERLGQEALNTAIKANPYVLIGSIVIGIILSIISHIRTATKEQQKFNKEVASSQQNARELASNFKLLAETALDSTKSYSEQNEALKELNRTYGDILPAQSLTIEGLKEMKGNYDAVTAAIYAKVKAQTQERMIQSISSEQGEKIAETSAKLSGWIKKITNNSKSAQIIVATLRKEIEEGALKSVEDLSVRVFELASQMTGIDFKFDKNSTDRLLFSGLLENLLEQVKDYQEAVEAVSNIVINPDTDVYSKLWQDLQKELDKNIQSVKEWRKENEGKINPFELDKQTKEKTIAEYERFAASLTEGLSAGNYKKEEELIVKKYIEQVRKEIKSLEGSQSDQWYNSVLEKAFRQTNADLSKLSSLFKKEDESNEDFIQRLKNRAEVLEKVKISYEKNPLSTNLSEEEFNENMKLLAAIKAALAQYPDFSKKATSGESELEKQLKAQISLLKKVGEEYKNNLKYYSKEEALAKTKKDYAAAFDESGLGSSFLDQIDLDAAGIIAALEKVGKKAGAKMKFQIEKEIANLKGNVDIEVKVENIDNTKKMLDDLFTKYQLTVELDKLGLTPELIKSLFDVDAISLEGLEKQVKDTFPDLDKLSKEELAVYKSTQDKIDKIRTDSLFANLKEYSQYLTKTVSARTLAEIEAQKKIAEVKANPKFSPEQQEEIVKRVKDETQKKQNKIDIDEFKNSDIYSQMFKDVQNLGTATIERLKMVLDELKKSFGELNPEQLKEINSYYIQLENELIKRNPFEELQKSLKEVNRIEKEGRSEDFLNEELLSYQAQEKSLKEQISDLELIASMKEQGRELDILDAEFLERNKEIISLTTQELREQLKEKNNSLKGVQTNIGVTNKDLASYTKARKSLTELGNRIKTINNLSQNAFGSIKTILQSMGVSADSTEMIFADMGMNLVDLVAQAVMFSMQLKLMKMEAQLFGETLNAALGPIGWAVIALQALTSIFSAFSKSHDNKRQKIIDQEKEKVENLQRAYENLEKAIESGLSIDLYAKSNDRIELLRQQIKSYEAMIAAEADKKDSDEGAIEGWKDDIQSIYDKINDIYTEMKETLLGTFKDISSTLGDAITTAFEEGTNAAKAWGESVNDIVKNIVKQLLISNFIEPEVQKWFENTYADMMPNTVDAQKRKEELDKANEALRLYDALTDNEKIALSFKGGYAKLLKDQEAAQKAYDEARRKAEGEAPKLEEDAIKGYEESLDGLFDVINGRIPEWLEKYLSNKASELSGLQQGISTVSEDTAQALEALLNSMRFIASDSNLALREIAVLLGADVGSNPLLAEMRIQTTLIRSINDLFSSVISPGHPTMGGFALKVIV